MATGTSQHTHEWTIEGKYNICTVCGKKSLKLDATNNDGLLIGTRKDGRTYTVRKDRRRYFFPSEWEQFLKTINKKIHRFFFITCLHTGGRAMEVLNLRHRDIDVKRGTVTFEIVKQRKAKKDFYSTGKNRSFFVASNFIKEYRQLIKGKNVQPNDYVFLYDITLPQDYQNINNTEKKKYYKNREMTYYRLFKRKLKSAGIEDWYNFSLHNIRKTYGMWMRTFINDFGELCYRMGHDMDTFIAHYGSSLIFTENERRHIVKILGDVR